MSIDLRNDGTSALSAASTYSDRPACGAPLRIAPTCGGDATPDDTDRTVGTGREDDHDRHLDRLRAMPDVRQAKIAKIKEQLKLGEYDSEAVLNKAIERMLDEMD